MDRIYLHCDLDYFFAQVAEIDKEKDGIYIKDKPIIIGGTSGRGVVSTCNYIAREYGVRSAMPIVTAQKLCPMGLFLPVRYERYVEISKIIFSVYKEFTDRIEPLSIDEAFLEFKGDYDDGMKIAKAIKKRVLDETKLTLSIGISYNMLNAKIGSDYNKPDGITVIKEEDMPEFFYPLPIGKIYGIGEKSVKKFANMGLYTVKDLIELPREFFLEYFGNNGAAIYERIRGIDKREICTSWERKSYGKEVTLAYDTEDFQTLELYLKEFAEEISQYLKGKNIFGKTITVKYKNKEFQSHTKSKTLGLYVNDFQTIYKIALDIANDIEYEKGIRLIGLTISNIENEDSHQLNFF